MPRTKKTDIPPPTTITDKPKTGGRQKGTPKTGGRQKGTPNKVNSDLKKWIHDFLANNTDNFEQALTGLEPTAQLLVMKDLIPKLLPFVVPKQTETTLNMDEATMKAVIESQRKVNDLFAPPDKQTT